MKTRTVDNSWDWNFGKGLADYADDALGVAYTVKMKILSWYKDCFFEMDSGIDWKNILGSKVSKEEADAQIKDIIQSEPEITELVYFDSSVTDRIYSATIRFKTIYNETIEVRI